MTFFTHEFEATLSRHPIGKGERVVTYSVVYLPSDMATDLPFDAHPRLRVDAEIADIPFNGAWQPAGDGRSYLMVPKAVFTDAGAAIGDVVEVRFRLADQDAVDVPEILQRALTSDAEAQAKWDGLTAGTKRGFAYRVASAKLPKTIDKRVKEVMTMIREGRRYGKGGRIV